MRVLSWNLWWRYGPWEQRQQAIAATLADVQPDLCGFQEVWGGPEGSLAIDLAGRLGMHWCWAEAGKAHDEDGTELFIGNAILSRWPITAQAAEGLPVIAVTARAMQGDRDKSIAAGATDYVTKPVDTEDLLTVMEVWLGAD